MTILSRIFIPFVLRLPIKIARSFFYRLVIQEPIPPPRIRPGSYSCGNIPDNPFSSLGRCTMTLQFHSAVLDRLHACIFGECAISSEFYARGRSRGEVFQDWHIFATLAGARLPFIVLCPAIARVAGRACGREGGVVRLERVLEAACVRGPKHNVYRFCIESVKVFF